MSFFLATIVILIENSGVLLFEKMHKIYILPSINDLFSV